MKSPKPIVAGALVAGGLLFTSAAAALTLPEEASDTAKQQVADVVAGEGQTVADERRQDEVDETEKEADAKEDEVEADETDGEEAGERPATHGSAVSALATSEETKALEGRARGEAISTLARTNGGAEEDAETEDAETEEVEDDAPGTEGRERAATAKARQGK